MCQPLFLWESLKKPCLNGQTFQGAAVRFPREAPLRPEEAGAPGLSTGPVGSGNRNTFHDALGWPVIKYCVMLGRLVVPHGDGIGRPTHTDLIFRGFNPVDQVGQQLFGFLFRQSDNPCREDMIYEEVTLSCHRVAPDDRMDLRRMIPAELRPFFFGNPPAKGLQNIVLGIESFDPALNIVWQVIVNRGRICEERIPADVRQSAGAKDPGEGGLFPERHIRVPFVRWAQERQDLIGQFQPVAGFDMQNFRMAGNMGRNRMAFQLAKIAAKADMLSMRYILIAEDQHLVAEERLSEIIDGCTIKRAPEVNAGNLSPENRTERGEAGAGMGGGPRGGLGGGHSGSP